MVVPYNQADIQLMKFQMLVVFTVAAESVESSNTEQQTFGSLIPSFENNGGFVQEENQPHVENNVRPAASEITNNLNEKMMGADPADEVEEKAMDADLQEINPEDDPTDELEMNENLVDVDPIAASVPLDDPIAASVPFDNTDSVSDDANIQKTDASSTGEKYPASIMSLVAFTLALLK